MPEKQSDAGAESRGVAFERLVSEYGEQLVALATRITGNPAGAQDVAQEAFIRLARQWLGAPVPSPQMTLWLRRTVHNICVDEMRAATRRAELHEDDARHRPQVQPPARGQGGSGGLSDAAADAADALRILSTRERGIVAMRVWDGLSYRELAEVTGLPEGTVGWILHEAMEKLAKHLSGKERLQWAKGK